MSQRSNGAALLEVRGLRARIDDKEILKGLDLTVNPGEVHAIMGPNGSGKSTFAGVLAGRDRAEVTGGTVTLDGKDLLALTPEARAVSGPLPGLPVPGGDPGRGQPLLPAHRAERPAQGPRRGGARRGRLPRARHGRR